MITRYAIIAAAAVILMLAGFLAGRAWERSAREDDELGQLREDQADDDFANTLAAIPSVPSHDGNPSEPDWDRWMDAVPEDQAPAMEEHQLTLADVYRFHPALEMHEPDQIDREWLDDGWVQLGDRTWMPPAEVLAGRPPGDALSDLLWHAALMKVG